MQFGCMIDMVDLAFMVDTPRILIMVTAFTQ
jgi:hypothetical protein